MVSEFAQAVSCDEVDRLCPSLYTCAARINAMGGCDDRVRGDKRPGAEPVTEIQAANSLPMALFVRAEHFATLG